MKILHSTIKKRWFDMILSGEKTEEYKEIKPFWVSKLVDEINAAEDGDFGAFFLKETGFWTMGTAIHYDAIQLYNGRACSTKYPNIIVSISDIITWSGKEAWGAEVSKAYFVIKLGEILSKDLKANN